MAYREIRVRPVVRYIITDFQSDDDFRNQSSKGLGVFDNAADANLVAEAICASVPGGVVYEPARQLRIDWLRGPDEPKEAIHWELYEVE